MKSAWGETSGLAGAAVDGDADVEDVADFAEEVWGFDEHVQAQCV